VDSSAILILLFFYRIVRTLHKWKHKKKEDIFTHQRIIYLVRIISSTSSLPLAILNFVNEYKPISSWILSLFLLIYVFMFALEMLISDLAKKIIANIFAAIKKNPNIQESTMRA